MQILSLETFGCKIPKEIFEFWNNNNKYIISGHNKIFYYFGPSCIDIFESPVKDPGFIIKYFAKVFLNKNHFVARIRYYPIYPINQMTKKDHLTEEEMLHYLKMKAFW